MMFDLGDDIILDNFRIPWVIWIQIFVMFLLTLTILLSYFGFFAIDDSSSTSNSLTTKTSSGYSPTIQTGESREGRREIGRASSNRVRRLENSTERDDDDGSFIKDLASSPVTGRFFHPCRYFILAKDAFLKCLGLGSGSHHFSDKEHQD